MSESSSPLPTDVSDRVSHESSSPTDSGQAASLASGRRPSHPQGLADGAVVLPRAEQDDDETTSMTRKERRAAERDARPAKDSVTEEVGREARARVLAEAQRGEQQVQRSHQAMVDRLEAERKRLQEMQQATKMRFEAQKQSRTQLEHAEKRASDAAIQRHNRLADEVRAQAAAEAREQIEREFEARLAAAAASQAQADSEAHAAALARAEAEKAAAMARAEAERQAQARAEAEEEAALAGERARQEAQRARAEAEAQVAQENAKKLAQAQAALRAAMEQETAAAKEQARVETETIRKQAAAQAEALQRKTEAELDAVRREAAAEAEAVRKEAAAATEAAKQQAAAEAERVRQQAAAETLKIRQEAQTQAETAQREAAAEAEAARQEADRAMAEAKAKADQARREADDAAKAAQEQSAEARAEAEQAREEAAAEALAAKEQAAADAEQAKRRAAAELAEAKKQIAAEAEKARQRAAEETAEAKAVAAAAAAKAQQEADQARKFAEEEARKAKESIEQAQQEAARRADAAEAQARTEGQKARDEARKEAELAREEARHVAAAAQAEAQAAKADAEEAQAKLNLALVEMDAEKAAADQARQEAEAGMEAARQEAHRAKNDAEAAQATLVAETKAVHAAAEERVRVQAEAARKRALQAADEARQEAEAAQKKFEAEAQAVAEAAKQQAQAEAELAKQHAQQEAAVARAQADEARRAAEEAQLEFEKQTQKAIATAEQLERESRAAMAQAEVERQARQRAQDEASAAVAAADAAAQARRDTENRIAADREARSRQQQQADQGVVRDGDADAAGMVHPASGDAGLPRPDRAISSKLIQVGKPTGVVPTAAVPPAAVPPAALAGAASYAEPTLEPASDPDVVAGWSPTMANDTDPGESDSGPVSPEGAAAVEGDVADLDGVSTPAAVSSQEASAGKAATDVPPAANAASGGSSPKIFRKFVDPKTPVPPAAPGLASGSDEEDTDPSGVGYVTADPQPQETAAERHASSEPSRQMNGQEAAAALPVATPDSDEMSDPLPEVALRDVLAAGSAGPAPLVETAGLYLNTADLGQPDQNWGETSPRPPAPSKIIPDDDEYIDPEESQHPGEQLGRTHDEEIGQAESTDTGNTLADSTAAEDPAAEDPAPEGPALAGVSLAGSADADQLGGEVVAKVGPEDQSGDASNPAVEPHPSLVDSDDYDAESATRVHSANADLVTPGVQPTSDGVELAETDVTPAAVTTRTAPAIRLDRDSDAVDELHTHDFDDVDGADLPTGQLDEVRGVSETAGVSEAAGLAAATGMAAAGIASRGASQDANQPSVFGPDGKPGPDLHSGPDLYSGPGIRPEEGRTIQLGDAAEVGEAPVLPADASATSPGPRRPAPGKRRDPIQPERPNANAQSEATEAGSTETTGATVELGRGKADDSEVVSAGESARPNIDQPGVVPVAAPELPATVGPADQNILREARSGGATAAGVVDVPQPVIPSVSGETPLVGAASHSASSPNSAGTTSPASTQLPGGRESIRPGVAPGVSGTGPNAGVTPDPGVTSKPGAASEESLPAAESAKRSLVTPPAADLGNTQDSSIVSKLKPRPGAAWVWSLAVFFVVLAIVVATIFWPKLANKSTPGAQGAATSAAVKTLLVALTEGDQGKTVRQVALLGVSDREANTVLLPASTMMAVPGSGRVPLSRSAATSPKGVSQSVASALDVRIDQSWVVSKNGFVAFVNGLGGLTMSIEQAISSGGLQIKAGADQQLSGAEAVAYATYLADGEPETSRSARWASVMAAVVRGVSSEPTKTSGDLGAVSDASTFIGSQDDIAGILSAAHLRAAQGQYASVVLPTKEIAVGASEELLTVDDTKATSMAKERFGDAYVGGAVDRIRVLVQDGVGSPALQVKARTKLESAKGLSFVDGGQAASLGVQKSMVAVSSDTPENRKRAYRVAEAMGLDRSAVGTVEQYPTDVDVMVVLGVDFAASGKAAKTEPAVSGSGSATTSASSEVSEGTVGSGRSAEPSSTRSAAKPTNSPSSEKGGQPGAGKPTDVAPGGGAPVTQTLAPGKPTPTLPGNPPG